MTVYSHKHTTAKRPRRRRHVVLFILFVFLAAAAIIGYVLYERSVRQDAPVEGKEVSLGYYDPNQTFESDWFTFQAAKSWRLEEKESKGGVFVYRSYRGANVEQELTIGVGKALPDMRTVYMSATAVSDGRLTPGTVSDRCSTYVPKSNFTSNPMDVVYEGAKFSCWVDGRSSYLGFSEVGGGNEFTLPRADGSKETYYFRYLDSRFSPQFQDALSMIRSFKAR